MGAKEASVGGWGTEIASDGSDPEPRLKTSPTVRMVPVCLSSVLLVFTIYFTFLNAGSQIQAIAHAGQMLYH